MEDLKRLQEMMALLSKMFASDDGVISDQLQSIQPQPIVQESVESVPQPTRFNALRQKMAQHEQESAGESNGTS